MDRTGRGGSHYHHRVYLGLLLFVVIGGLPILGVPSLRHRLQARVETLRSAWQGKSQIQPALASVGENRAPFPKEYERPPWKRPEILPKYEPPARAPFHITVGGNPAAREQAAAGARGRPELKIPQTRTDAEITIAEKAPGSGIEYRKGKGEQDAYDVLVNSNPTLGAMIKGRDPALKFQDWSAALMGQDSYNVSVTFVQTGDQVVRKYIWNVKVESKTVIPLSAYAREISK
jgi:hypothetical protein